MHSSRSAKGAKTLPGEYFWSPEIYQQETRDVFQREWICVGRESDVPRPGDYFLYEADNESVVVLRDEDNKVNCFYNVCRHRGTRIAEDACGHFRSRIRCPYHAWSYDLAGTLRSAPNMNGVDSFDLNDHSLHALHCVTWQGFVFVCFDPHCEPFESCFQSLHERFDPWQVRDLSVAHEIRYSVRANWKTVFQNYNECYHCAGLHPQFSRITSVDDASNDFEEGRVLGGPMILADSCQTASTDGNYCGEPFAQLSPEDRRRVYFYSLFPSLFVSLHPDYVLTHRLERRGCDATAVVCQWLFPPGVANKPDFDASNVVQFWDVTNRQDWRACELSQLGTRSRVYRPGPYSNLEHISAAFDRHYLSVIGRGRGDTESPTDRGN